MDRIRVGSSTVASVGYEDASSTLEVEFKGGDVYLYFGVPRHHFEALTSGSGSVGKYLARHIKGRYRYRKLR